MPSVNRTDSPRRRVISTSARVWASTARAGPDIRGGGTVEGGGGGGGGGGGTGEGAGGIGGTGDGGGSGAGGTGGTGDGGGTSVIAASPSARPRPCSYPSGGGTRPPVSGARP